MVVDVPSPFKHHPSTPCSSPIMNHTHHPHHFELHGLPLGHHHLSQHQHHHPLPRVVISPDPDLNQNMSTGYIECPVEKHALTEPKSDDDSSFCCKLSYTDYCSIESRDLASSCACCPQQSGHMGSHHPSRRNSTTDDGDNWCNTCASHPKLNLLMFVMCYVLFMVFCSVIFAIIERPEEVRLRIQSRSMQTNFLHRHPSVSVEELNELLQVVTKLQDHGIGWQPLKKEDILSRIRRDTPLERSPSTRGLPQSVPSPQDMMGRSPALEHVQFRHVNASLLHDLGAHNWEFSSSLLFVTSLVTTIGYGHITPITETGKLVSILLSAIGIPLTLTLLSTLSSLLLRGPMRKLETALAIVSTRFCSSASVFMVRITHLVILTLVLLVTCIFIPAYGFSYWEPGWTYLDSVYYCYISLTTVGLGDFVPAIGGPELGYFRLATIVYLYMGLTMIMLWLALIYRIPQLNLNQILLKDEGNKPSVKETLRILHHCSGHQSPSHGGSKPRTPSTSRSSLSKSYGTQLVNSPSSP